MFNLRSVIYGLCTLCILSASSKVGAQAFVDPRDAKTLFTKGNYLDAIKAYQKLIIREPNNQEYLHAIGVCYLRTNIDKKKAIQPLEKALNTANISSTNTELYIDLGTAYQYAYRFDDALKMFGAVKDKVAGKKLEQLNRAIENCITAKELVKFPVDVTFKNVGQNVNSKYPDYYPFVSKDDKFIAFTSRRQGNIGGIIEFDGYYSSDVWTTTLHDFEFSKAKNGGVLVNSSFDEQAVGISDDGTVLYVYIDNIKEFGDIYRSERAPGKSFPKIEKLGENINSSGLETSASLSSDGNTLFFASDQTGGKGGIDIFMTRKLPDGSWAKPQNLSSKINTKYDEGFPTLSADGKTLYFCSEGHTNMGGFDVFKAEWNNESNEWSNATNLGFPINTPEDNRTISFTEDGKHAYVSALRDDGFGDLDIYQIIFNNVANTPAVYTIKLSPSNNDTLTITDAFVTVTDTDDMLIGEYKANPNNGKFIIILAEGEYLINIETEGYKTMTHPLSVSKTDHSMGEIKKNIKLIKQ